MNETTDRKVVEIPTKAMELHKQRLERKARMKANGAAVARWALTDPTYDCTGACRENNP
jgi:phosphoribosylaminoimidazole carboxylase (NCAIR synthetase)